MNEIDLKQYGILRSEKVSWRFPESPEDVLSHIKSKGLRKFLRSAKEILAEKGIRYESKVLSDEDFENWLPYYVEKMTENEYQVIATMEWLQKKREANLTTVEGIFFYQNDKLVGSAIFTRNGQEKATMAFKASDRINLSSESNSSLGATIDYLFLDEMVTKKITLISAGRSKNAFGVANTFGYLDYKLRFGYEPQNDPKSPLLDSVPVNEEGVVLFFGVKEGKLSMYELKPKTFTKEFEQARFATPELPFEIIEY
jgi:hypothetical protein